MRALPKTLRRTRAAYQALVPYGTPHRQYLLKGAVATVFLVAARLAFPWPLRGLMEVVFPKKGSGRGLRVVSLVPHYGDPVVWLIGAFVAIILIWAVAESRQRLSFTRYAVGLSTNVRAAAIARVPGRAASGSAAGDLIATVTGDTSRVKTGVKSILIGISRNGAFFLGVAVIVTFIDPVVGLVFVTGGLATVVAGAWGASRSSRIIGRSRQREGALADELHRHLAGEEELSAPTRGDREPDSKATRVEGAATFTVHAILASATCAMLFLTISDSRAGKLSAGSVFTILAYVLLMHNKTVGLGRSIVRVGRVLPSAERIADLVKVPRSGTRAQARPGREDPAHGTQPAHDQPQPDFTH